MEPRIPLESEIEVILGNSNSRFSGVTSTMLQTLTVQSSLINVRVMGAHHLPNNELHMGFWKTAKLCRKLLRSGKFRVFHARRNDEMIQALVLKRIFGAKIKILFTSTAQRHHSTFTRWLMKQMDLIISTCEAAASFLEKPPQHIVPHGVRTDVYYPPNDKEALRAELGLSGKHSIGIFGRVREQKGIHLFVNACIEHLSSNLDYHAVIVGKVTPDNRSFVDKLKQDINDAGLTDRIQFLGEQPFSELPRLFQSMSLVAALSENEGFGLTPLEAMSSGVAVLTTKAGAWPEIIVDGEQGFTVENDQKAISKKLGEMISDHDQLVKMGQKGRCLILDKYSIEREAKALCDIYKSMQ